VYAVQTAIEAGIDVAETAIDAKTSAVANSIAKKITADHVLQKEFASTIKTSEVVLLCAISPKALKIFGKTVKNQAGSLLGTKKLPWGSWADYRKVMHEGKEYAKIGDRLYTEHAVSRMLPSSLGRYASSCANTKEGMSISPTFVEHIIKNGTRKKVVLSPGVERIIYSSGSAEVYTEQGGRIVVTVNSLRGRK
jgi:hypothetical protein